MTPAQAAWVREHVWPSQWLRSYTHIPSPFLNCACTGAPSLECQRGEHGLCRMRGQLIDNETVVATSDLRVAHFPEPYAHSTPMISGTNAVAWVWLAGRPCRWLCTCFCHQPTTDVPREATRGPQLDLFVLGTP